MPSLEDLYKNLPEEITVPHYGLYRVTNIPWVAERTPDEPLKITR